MAAASRPVGGDEPGLAAWPGATVQGLIVQSVHALGPTSQLAKTGLACWLQGILKALRMIWGGGRELLKRSIIIQLFFSSSVNS